MFEKDTRELRRERTRKVLARQQTSSEIDVYFGVLFNIFT